MQRSGRAKGKRKNVCQKEDENEAYTDSWNELVGNK